MALIRLHLLVLLLIAFFAKESQQGTSRLEAFLNKDIQVLDDGENISEKEVKAIAKIVCKNSDTSDKQITQIKTIVELQQYLAGLELSKGALADCANLYKESLVDLNRLVSESNRNACSDKKISQIREYHRKYVSESVYDRAEASKAPKILKIFFIHFAFRVSAICKVNLISNLDEQAANLSDDEINLELASAEVNDVLSELSTFVNPVKAVEDFDDVQLYWDTVLLDGPPDTDQITGEPVRLYMKVKDASNLVYLQSKCRNKFRKIYGKIIMPVVRLADCGYSAKYPPIDYERDRLIELRESTRNWYTATQVCEALLPIKFISDSSLIEGEVVRLSKDEGRSAASNDKLVVNPAAEKEVDYEPKTNAMTYENELPIKADYSRNMLANIDLEESIADRALGRALDIASENAAAIRDPLHDMF